MKCDYEKTAKRIKQLRKEAGYKSIEKFADELGYSRQTVAKWENGEATPTLDTLYDMVSILDCDMGYLLGLYDTRYFEHAEICEETGLSEDAVNVLKENRMNAHSDFVNRYIINGAEISQAIERLKEAPTSVTDRMKYYEFDVMDSFLDLVKEYIRRG